MPDNVTAVFALFPAPAKARLLEIRDLILDIAEQTASVGPVQETLKWGQPSYLCNSGSPIRLGIPKSGGYAIYCHCQTSLISDFSALVGATFKYDGNRAVLFDTVEHPDLEALSMLISAALAYKIS